jgi:superfamily II DNA helicase RecQ
MVALSISRQHNFIGILPTGGGKSLVFMLPTLQEEGFFTIVLIPNKALLWDMLRKAKEAGISSMQWTTSSHKPTTERILFVALETATSRKFLECVYTLNTCFDDFVTYIV